MEIVSGVSSWKLTIRPGGGGNHAAAGSDLRRAGRPAGDPLRPARHRTGGSRPLSLRRKNGRGAGPGDLRTAPRKKRRGITAACGAWRFRRGWAGVGEYAFFNCGALKTLELYDGIGFWGGGALMNCRSLDTVRLTRISEEQGISLAYFADELSRELDVTVTETDGTAARLIFPEFLEVYEENCPAHHFDYTICGAGISLPPLLPAKKAVLEGIRPALERIFGNGARRGHRPPPLLVAAALPQRG